MPDATTSLPGSVFIKPSDRGGDMSPKDGHDYYDYTKASGVFNKLIDGWGQESSKIEREKAIRYTKDTDSISLRERGILLADEMYCPVRLIDQNIRAEQPALVRYLTQSQRSIIFESPDAVPVDGKEKLEADFTTKARYLEWEIPWIECFDGAQANGRDSVEVIFDPEKPGNFAIEHIGPGRLIFAVDSEDIQAQEVLMIEKLLTSNQLRNMDGFDQDQVGKLIGSNNNGANEAYDCLNKCYKCYFKQDGVVHVCWYTNKGASGFLRAPEMLFLGKRDFTAGMVLEEGAEVADYPPMPEKHYPIYLLPYVVNSDPKITELAGRTKLDEPYQEGASALQSAMINGAMRACKVMAAPKQNAMNIPPNAAPEMTNKVVGHGRLWDQAMEFFHTPWPDAAMPQFVDSMVRQNKQEQGSGISFATVNRKDSGKTATEINAATEMSQELGSVQVILLSIFIRKVYACCWGIYQNRVLQGKILIKDPSVLMLFGDDIETDPATGYVTRCSKAAEYILKSSGDVDVVQRQQHLQKLMQGWEVFGKTALAPEFLKDIIRYSFPEDASKYINILDTGVANEADALKQLLLKTAKVLQAVIMNPAEASDPQMMPAMQQLAMQIMAAIGQPSIPGAPTTPMQQAQMQSMQMMQGGGMKGMGGMEMMNNKAA